MKEPSIEEFKGILELSDTQYEIFIEISKGKSLRDIAEPTKDEILNHGRFCRSIKTVETHKAIIKRKLGLSSAGQLVRLAARWEYYCELTGTERVKTAVPVRRWNPNTYAFKQVAA